VASSKPFLTDPIGQISQSPSAHIRLSAIARREQLIQVAIDLFSRKGFKGTTTREIAAAAGVTEAIIFRHFETKEHLYTAIIDRKVNSPDTAEWIAALRSAMDRDDDEAVIRQLIGAIISMHKKDPKFERLMQYAALEGNEIALRHMRQVTASIVDVFRSYFLRRQKQGHLRPFGPDAALMAIIGLARHYALGKYVHELKEQCLSDSQALESFTRIAMDGLCVAPRRKLSLSGRKR
jgi:TetR/AcrR family transcriptional regulator